MLRSPAIVVLLGLDFLAKPTSLDTAVVGTDLHGAGYTTSTDVTGQRV
jgi:hypothetical protein